MSIAHSFHVGGLRCFTLEGGRQRLDGGAMFGVVPKPLWSKRIPPDERNRIPLGLRCLLVEHPEGLVLIDTGLGNKEDQKFLDIYGVENRGSSGPTQLEDSLLDIGYQPDEVKWVINTHLHFDHAGGNTVRSPSPLTERGSRNMVGSRDTEGSTIRSMIQILLLPPSPHAERGAETAAKRL